MRLFSDNWFWVGAALSIGLYFGRLLSEILRPGIWGAIITTLISVSLAIFLFRGKKIRWIWPSYLLLIYVLYPEADPGFAALVGLLALLAFALTNPPTSIEFFKSDASTAFFAVVVGLGFLILYWATLAADVLPADSGELQLVAARFGVAHPPGFPLYTMAAGVFSKLPFGQNPAYRVNLFSAFTSAAALVFVFLSVKRISGSNLGGLLTAAALGTAATFWAQATTANIRSLTALLTALAIFAFIQFRLAMKSANSTGNEPKQSEEEDNKVPKLPLLLLFFLSLAFGISHHPSLIFIAAVLLAGIIIARPGALKTPGFWLAAGLSAAAAFLPLLYLPIRASSGAVGAPDDLNTLQGFINHVLALGFRGDFFYFIEPNLLWERLKVMANVMSFQFSPLLLAGMLVGFVLLFIKDRFLAIILGASFLLHTLISAMYRAPQTVEYMMPAYIPAAVLLGYGAGMSAKYASSYRLSGRLGFLNAISAVYVSGIIVVLLVQFFDNYRSFSYLHNATSTRNYVDSIFESAPERSVVLADWHWATPMWYLQEVENQRPDLTVKYVFPGDEPYEETWARRIEEELAVGNIVISTHYNESAYSQLPPSAPMGEAFIFGREIENLPEEFIQLESNFGGVVQLLGYKLEADEISLDKEIVLTLAWQSLVNNPDLSNIYGQIIDQDGSSVANDDQGVRHVLDNINLTQLRLSLRPGTIPGEYAAAVGANGSEPLLSESGERLLSLTSVVIKPSDFPPFTSNPTHRVPTSDSGNGRIIGFDWDNTLAGIPRLYVHWQVPDGYFSETFDPQDSQLTLPEYYGPWGIPVSNRMVENKDTTSSYVPFGQGIIWTGETIEPNLNPLPGDNIRLEQNFVSTKPVDRDLTVSLRLVGYEEDGFHWAWWDLDDGIPALGAIPTLKWVAGSTVKDPHWNRAAEAAAPSQVISPLLRIYDAFTERALPILDERISQQFQWVPLGETTVGDGSE